MQRLVVLSITATSSGTRIPTILLTRILTIALT